jgi:hypothetical protein
MMTVRVVEGAGVRAAPDQVSCVHACRRDDLAPLVRAGHAYCLFGDLAVVWPAARFELRQGFTRTVAPATWRWLVPFLRPEPATLVAVNLRQANSARTLWVVHVRGCGVDAGALSVAVHQCTAGDATVLAGRMGGARTGLLALGWKDACPDAPGDTTVLYRSGLIPYHSTAGNPDVAAQFY